MNSIIIFALNHIDLQSSKLQKLEVASGRRGASSCSLLSRSMAFVLLCSSFPDLNPPASDDSLGSKSPWLEPPIRNHKSDNVFSTAERESNPHLTTEDSVDGAKKHSVLVTKTSGISVNSRLAQNY